MKVSCQGCGQHLPKTAVMCPNCGGRHFSETSETMANTPPPPTGADIFAQRSAATVWQQPTPAPFIAPSMPVYEPPSHQQHPTLPQNPPAPMPMATTSALPPRSRRLASSMQYAGFVRRGLAYLVDVAVMAVLLALAYQLLLPNVLKQLGVRSLTETTLLGLGLGIYVVSMAFFSCLGRQATIGKIIMGLWVFGMQGQRIGFFHALFRELLKLVLLPFAFIMWFTARKQTLHDVLARTVVLFDPH